MLIFVDQSHHPQSMEVSILFLIVDDFSKLMCVTILKNNSKAFRAFQKFKTLTESESNGASIKCLMIDCGGKFTSEKIINVV